MTRPRVLLIESRGPNDGPGCAEFLADGLALSESARVQVLLLGDAVTAAVPGAVREVPALVEAGAHVAVDGWSVDRRAMAETALEAGVVRGALEDLAGDVADPDVRVVWH